MSHLPIKLFFVLTTLFTFGCDSPDTQTDGSDSENAIVLLQFKTQPEKGAEAVTAFDNLIQHVKQEPHFVSIKLHVDPNDPTHIMLYEEWDDLAYYQTDHDTTEHLQDFKANSVNFLAGPPEVSFWKINKVFE